MIARCPKAVIDMTEEQTKIEWCLNAQNQETKHDGEKLTRAVQNIIDLNDDNRLDVLADAFGAEALAYLIEEHGLPNRVLGVAMIDGRAVMLGDCACRGAKCRASWGWIWNARDLNMSGHRGSLKASPCEDAVASVFTPENGFMYAAPYGMDAEQFYRFQRPHWGDADKIGLQNFLAANIATAEGRGVSGDWVVDA